MSEGTRPLRVAIVGAGPAGSHAADALMKHDDLSERGGQHRPTERMPAPFNLIRPRCGTRPPADQRGIINALHKGTRQAAGAPAGQCRLRHRHQPRRSGASLRRRDLLHRRRRRPRPEIPGIELDGSYGAGEVRGLYDGHPTSHLAAGGREGRRDRCRQRGPRRGARAGKTGDELLPTEIPASVYEGLQANKAIEVHVFGRRGPAQAKFTPLELKELDHSPTSRSWSARGHREYDEGSAVARLSSKDHRPGRHDHRELRHPRTQAGCHPWLFLHFFENPVEVLGRDNKVVVAPNAPARQHRQRQARRADHRLGGRRDLPGRGLPVRQPAGIPFDSGRRDPTRRAACSTSAHLTGLYTAGWISAAPSASSATPRAMPAPTVQCIVDDTATEQP